MKCPYCQQQMQEGFLSSRSPFSGQRRCQAFPFRQEGRFASGWKAGAGCPPRAYLCRSCKTVVTQYQ